MWSIDEARLTPDLAELSALEHLASCSLIGQIPTELGSLTNLKELEIDSYTVGSVNDCFNFMTGRYPVNCGTSPTSR